MYLIELLPSADQCPNIVTWDNRAVIHLKLSSYCFKSPNVVTWGSSLFALFFGGWSFAISDRYSPGSM